MPGANTVTLGPPTAAQCFGTEGIVLDRKNTVLYIYGNTRTPVALGGSASPTITGTVTQPAPAVLTAATTATTVGAAGAAAALPATPSGYLSMSINGTTFKIPYYAV